METLCTRAALVCALAFSTITAFCQTTDNFNSRPGTALNTVKSYLQNKCWQFPGFAINTENYTTGIEGDGAMISDTGKSSYQKPGIYTPVLDVTGKTDLSFTYTLHNNEPGKKSLRIYLAQADNKTVELLDSLDLTQSRGETVSTYNKTLNCDSGAYRLFINYENENGTTRIAIDQVFTGSGPHYSNGCNQAPSTAPDKFAGKNDYTASGNIFTNDTEPDNEFFTPYVIASPDGTVNVMQTGEFYFTPNPNFTGASASFTYIACDNGNNQVCSKETLVTLNFLQPVILPVNMINFVAKADEKAVVLNWTTTFENNNDHFELERSLNGTHYEKEANIKGQGTTGITHVYHYTDRTPERIMLTKDLYYRLKQVDLDGTSTYSKVLIVRIYKSPSVQMISVTPNPAKNDIRVSVQLRENSFIVMKVSNSNGTEVMRRSEKSSAGENHYSLEGTSRLAKGVYFLEVIVNSKERMMIKVIKD